MLSRNPSRGLITIICALAAIGNFPTSSAQLFPRRIAVCICCRARWLGGHWRPGAIFWKETQGLRLAIRGYNLDTAAPFLVAERAGDVFDLAVYDMTVAWAERDAATAQPRILDFDLGARRLFTVRSFRGLATISEIAID